MKWISVKDRMPETGYDVLLFTEEIETYGRRLEYKEIYCNVYRGFFDGKEWLTSFGNSSECFFKVDVEYPRKHVMVTHWMPLPDPPELPKE